MQVGGRPVLLTGTDDAQLRRHRYGLVSGAVDGFGIGVTHGPVEVGDGRSRVRTAPKGG